MKSNMSRACLYALVPALMAGFAPQAAAQNANLQAAQVGTCNIKGTVTLTVLGTTSSYPLSCLNATTKNLPGQDDHSTTGDLIAGVPGVANVATVKAPYGRSDYSTRPGVTVLTGGAGAEQVSLIQNQIQTSGVDGSTACTTSTGDGVVHCVVDMKVATLAVNGQPVQLPANPIPFDHPIAVADLGLQVSVLNLGLVNIPLSGALYLNRIRAEFDSAYQVRLEHSPISVELQGEVSILGAGLIAAKVVLDDHSNAAFEWLPIADTRVQSLGAYAVEQHSKLQQYFNPHTHWCVAKPEASDADLQAAQDFACSQVDCSPIYQSCYLPNTVASHASFAFNRFFKKKGPQPGKCFFSGTAVVTQQNPSSGSCQYD